jgi:DNA-binding CsgD family transcriptional regulator
MIADAIGISKWTVKEHFRRSLRKLAAKNRAHAVARAFRAGVIS